MNIIGIDLGTSNSAAAVLRGRRPVIIPSAEGISIGGKAFPSYAALTADGLMLVGEPACRIAGLEVARLVNEPTAASLAYGLDRLGEELEKRIETALRETKEALLKKDVNLATERAETLRKILQEAGADRVCAAKWWMPSIRRTNDLPGK